MPRDATDSSPSVLVVTRGEITATPGEPRTFTFPFSARRLPHVSSRRCTFPEIRCSLPSPTYNCTADEEALLHLISIFDWQTTVPETALGYRFNIVLRGREQTPLEAAP